MRAAFGGGRLDPGRYVPLIEDSLSVDPDDRVNNKRDRLWRAPAVLDALDAFSARAGRRQRPY